MSKPVVAVVYSESEGGSLESKHMGLYIGAHVAATGYAQVNLISYSPAGMAQASPQRISYVPRGKSSPIDAPSSDVQFSHFNAIGDCDVLLVTLSAADTDSFCDKVLEMIPDKRGIVVFGMQRGVKSHSTLKTRLSNKKGFIVVEGSVNFVVVPAAKSGALVSLVPQTGFIMERLSKDVATYAEGPVNLIEATDFPVLYQKIITPHTWGVLVYETVYALNVISGGTVRSTLQDSDWRLIYATMIREACECLFDAAKGGAWAPSLELILSFGAGLWMLEMILVFPDPLFTLCALLLGLPMSNEISPGQADVVAGKKTDAADQLEELTDAGSRYHNPMSVTKAVLNKLRIIEGTPGGLVGNSSAISANKSELLSIIGKSNSVVELRYWILRLFTFLSFAGAIFFFLFH